MSNDRILFNFCDNGEWQNTKGCDLLGRIDRDDFLLDATVEIEKDIFTDKVYATPDSNRKSLYKRLGEDFLMQVK